MAPQTKAQGCRGAMRPAGAGGSKLKGIARDAWEHESEQRSKCNAHTIGFRFIIHKMPEIPAAGRDRHAGRRNRKKFGFILVHIKVKLKVIAGQG